MVSLARYRSRAIVSTDAARGGRLSQFAAFKTDPAIDDRTGNRRDQLLVAFGATMSMPRPRSRREQNRRIRTPRS
jgi:hypothetical protein